MDANDKRHIRKDKLAWGFSQSVPFFEGGMGIGAVEVFLAVFHLLQLNVLGIL